jgi:hypothetical protein
LIFAVHEQPEGVETKAGPCVVYDLVANVARFGAARVEGPAVVWTIGESALDGTPALTAEVDPDPTLGWVARCDRVDFPPGSVAYRHVHPGPGIRRLLFGSLRIESEGESRVYGPGEPWFEGSEQPVLATASETEPTAFVRVLLLPGEWAGRRTIRYLDPADDERPKRQRAEILLEEPLAR